MISNAIDRSRGFLRLPVTAVVLVAALEHAPPVAAAGYTITDLAHVGGGPGGGPVTAWGKPWVSINNNGQIAISGQDSITGVWAARYYSSGQTTVLSPPYFKAFGLDSSGNIVGGKDYDGFGIYTSVAVWQSDGTTTVLGQPDDGGVQQIATSAAFAANEQGKIVGGSDPFGHEIGRLLGSSVLDYAYSRPTHAFLYDQGTFHDLGTLGGNYSLAYEINNNGRIVGMSTTAEPTSGLPAVFHAAYSDGGALQDLNSLVGPSDWTLQSATDINDAGQITGWGAIDGQTRAYLFDSGVVHELDVLPGYDFSIGRGINAAGDVVGYSATGEIGDAYFNDDAPFYHYLTSTGEDRAFLYRNGTMHDLNSFIDPASGWTIQGATDINDSGQIVGWGMLAGEPYVIHALLLTPVPEPSGLVLGILTITAMLGIAALRSRRLG